jgi:hypothetical protein
MSIDVRWPFTKQLHKLFDLLFELCLNQLPLREIFDHLVKPELANKLSVLN